MASDNKLLGKVDPVMQQLLRNPTGTSVYPGPAEIRDAELEPFDPLVRNTKRRAIKQSDLESAAEILNWVGSIGGLNAAKPPLNALRFAEKMERAGARPESIWKGYGLMRDKAGNWMFEIPDDKMRLNVTKGPRPEYTDKGNAGFYTDKPQSWAQPPMREPHLYPHLPAGTRVGDVVEHPELFAQYPHLQNLLIDVPIDFTGSLRGSYNPTSQRVMIAGGKAQDVPGVVAHELGHAVQHFEEFPNGGNPQQFRPQVYNDVVREAKLKSDMFDSLIAKHGLDATSAAKLRYSITEDPNKLSRDTNKFLSNVENTYPELFAAARERALLQDSIRRMDATAYDQYRALHGEQNANAIARRIELTPRQRWEQPFTNHYTVPMENQLLGNVYPWKP